MEFDGILQENFVVRSVNMHHTIHHKVIVSSGQSYKASTLVNYDSRVVSNVLVITSLES